MPATARVTTTLARIRRAAMFFLSNEKRLIPRPWARHGRRSNYIRHFPREAKAKCRRGRRRGPIVFLVFSARIAKGSLAVRPTEKVMMKTHGLCLSILLLAAGSGLAQPLDAPAVDAIMRDALKAWQVPGAAVAIVKGEEVLYLKGFGVKELGGTEPVTPDTLFPLASCTKAFTTTAMAMLVDEGKVGWDDPVRKHVPYFHLA